MYLLKLIKFSYLAILFGATACQKKEPATIGHFPIDSLLHAQAKLLTEVKATLIKKAQINGSEEALAFTPANTAAWMKELDIFRSLNTLNKPGYLSNYTVTEQADEKTNLTARNYAGNANLPVVWLTLRYQKVPRNIRSIEALYREESLLIKGSRLLVLEFQELNNKIILTSYSIEGGQEIFLGKPVEFSLSGTISVTHGKRLP
jgi:hypothetical protein